MIEVELRKSSGPVPCKHWVEVPKEFGSQPECAFNEDGSFNPDNWNCELMNQLRDHAQDTEVWAEDEHMAIMAFPNEPKFAILAYYKHRGRTDRFWIWEMSKDIRLGTLADAEVYVKSWEKQRGGENNGQT